MVTKYPRFECFNTYSEIMGRYYLERKVLAGEKPVAYVTSGAPVEVLEALDVLTIYPENYGALCGARQASVGLCELAEAEGYPADLCSYAKGHIAASRSPESAPLDGLPRPDMLVCCSNICGTVVKWYEALADYYGCPLFVLDVPFQREPEPEPHVIGYVAAQMEDFIAWSETQVGRKLDAERFVHTLQLSREAVNLWTEIRELGAHRPSPLNAPELFLAMAPIVVLRGTQAAVDFYRLMKAEAEERIAEGVAAVPGERVRLLWDNIAIWYRLFRFYRPFAEQGACFVADTYTNAWSVNLTLDEPILGLARAYAAPFINLDLSTRARVVQDLARRFDVDGMVMHANRSCKPFSLTQLDLRAALRDELGLPTLILEADMTDARLYNEGVIKERVAAFMEMVGKREA
jgi:benzoyl-CoA reductase/2-hydroxyglutaryl-CoA dehydratase subunit BcrC/BadD/HgdB